MEDESEYYKQFLESIAHQQDLPSDEEDFLVKEEPVLDYYAPRIPKSELVDLVLESGKHVQPVRTVYRPVMPVYTPKFINKTVYITPEQRIALLSQIEVYVQLVLQALFLSHNYREKDEFSFILLDILHKCKRLSNHVDLSFLVHGRSRITMPTSISILNVPLVEAVRQCFPPKDLEKLTLSRKNLKNNLMQYSPAFVRAELLPLEDPLPPRRNKHGFTILDDMLLLQGIHRSTDSDYIHDHWLATKTPPQIKNRIKNLKSKKYTAKNEAQLKIMEFLDSRRTPLSEDEYEKLRRGIQWFGIERAVLIQKYFLPNRTLKQITDSANVLRQQLLSNFTQESLKDEESCSCSCQCQDLFEVYYLP